MRVNAVIVAAGEGKRMGGNVTKAFLSLGNRPIILHTLTRFATSQSVRKVILVTAEEEVTRLQKLIVSDPALVSLECRFQTGGLRRQDSVSRGLKLLDPDCEVAVIHDGVRPFVSPRLIDRCVEAAYEKGAVVVGMPVRDTIKVLSSGRLVRETPPRESLWAIQTPQAFRVEIIREAFERAIERGIEATDDAMLVEQDGKAVAVLEGEPTNIKITLPEDLIIAEALLREGKVP